jgi:hypothetical protein
MFQCQSIVVCVDFDDYLALTLPLNKRHFVRTLVVTSPRDTKTQDVALGHGCSCYVTSAFYEKGAYFNKGAAMEEAFDLLDTDTWTCIWDCDIVMPEVWELPETMHKDCLYGPKRRLLTDVSRYSNLRSIDLATLPCPTPDNEFAGYFQLFHGSLPRPWYTTTWKHAGGCDSDFQARFPQERLVRLPFDVLHLGPEGIPERGTRVGLNWTGRISPRLDTEVCPEANYRARLSAIDELITNRNRFGTSKEHL